MSVTVPNESATTAEAIEVLMERLPASKVARLLSSWQIGQGDYLKLREELFASETVQSLCQAANASGHPMRMNDELKSPPSEIDSVAGQHD
jgi:hypothetical protein